MPRAGGYMHNKGALLTPWLPWGLARAGLARCVGCRDRVRSGQEGVVKEHTRSQLNVPRACYVLCFFIMFLPIEEEGHAGLCPGPVAEFKSLLSPAANLALECSSLIGEALPALAEVPSMH